MSNVFPMAVAAYNFAMHRRAGQERKRPVDQDSSLTMIRA